MTGLEGEREVFCRKHSWSNWDIRIPHPTARCVVDVQYLYGVVAQAIEDLVGIAACRYDPHIAAARRRRTFRPTADAGHNVTDASFDLWRQHGIARCQPFADVTEIALCRRGEDDLH
jgi:hypothetical protein